MQYIAGIVLAAGTSSRMGQSKLLLPWGNTTVLGQVLNQARSSYLEDLTLVLGHEAKQISQKIDLQGIQVVVNPYYAQGQSTSLQAGLDHLPQKIQAVMFLLGDQPLVSSQVINTIILAYQRVRAGLILPVFEGQRGNPVLIQRSLFPALSKIKGDTGARVLFEDYADSIHEIPVSEAGVCLDMDTWREYEQLLRHSRK